MAVIQLGSGSNFGGDRGGRDESNFLKALCAISLTLPVTPNCSAVRDSSLKKVVKSRIAACITDAFAWVLVTVTVVWPEWVVFLPIDWSMSGLLVMASWCLSGFTSLA